MRPLPKRIALWGALSALFIDAAWWYVCRASGWGKHRQERIIAQQPAGFSHNGNGSRSKSLTTLYWQR